MNILETKNLTYTYSQGTPFAHDAITDVSVAVREGEFLGIIGHTGSGKSTLVQHLNGLFRPSSGQVLLNGRDIWENSKAIRSVRFQVGMVFQYPEHQLFEETVAKDIAFGPKNMGLSEEEIAARVQKAAEFAGLPKVLLEKSPFDLSGGEKRRAAIAGVIAMDPQVLILDEPTAGLDPMGRDDLLEQIASYHRERKNTVLLVSHSMEDIAKYSDRVLVMNESRAVMLAPTAEIFSHGRELQQMGLQVPQVTRIFMRLRELGCPVNDSVYTVEQALAEIRRAAGTAPGKSLSAGNGGESRD